MSDLYFMNSGNYKDECGGDLIDFHTYTGEDVYVYGDTEIYFDFEKLYKDTDYFLTYYNDAISKISNLIKEELYLVLYGESYNEKDIFVFDDIAKLRYFIKSKERLEFWDDDFVDPSSQYIKIVLNSNNTITIKCSSAYVRGGYEEYTFGYIRKKDLESLKSALNISDDLFNYQVKSHEFNQYKNIMISNLYYGENEYYDDELYSIKDRELIKNNWDDMSEFLYNLRSLHTLHLQALDKEEVIKNEEFNDYKTSNTEYSDDELWLDDMPF